jgi:hypothetical protein
MLLVCDSMCACSRVLCVDCKSGHWYLKELHDSIE